MCHRIAPHYELYAGILGVDVYAASEKGIGNPCIHDRQSKSVSMHRKPKRNIYQFTVSSDNLGIRELMRGNGHVMIRQHNQILPC
jgi:hypothetical protein